ncbi:chorismate mutase [Candidatus Gracilibacteria bacterium]|nr:chorismate mutase [Candidatus Gracilibacteria bacterium]NUJ99236.1 chorismate mutase [Candidatus Gracilibacteria bacterium]
MDYQTVLKIFRDQIEEIDIEILNLFAKRFEISLSIGNLKKENNLPILDIDRFNTLLEKLKQEGKRNNLDEDFVEDIWNRVHRESISRQGEI